MTSQGPGVALLVGMSSAGPLAFNIFVPSMPAMVEVFDTRFAVIQLTVTFYLVAFALAQLVYGPLSDRYGRRPTVLAGLGVYVGASMICLVSPSIEILIVGRALQGVGGCAGFALGRAIARDVYGRDRSASVIAAITMVMAVAPAIAPAVGGHLHLWFGWRASFVLLVVYGGAVLIWAALTLPETLPEPGERLDLMGIARSYRWLAGSPVFLGYALHASSTVTAWYAYIAGFPYVLVELLERPPTDYGYYFILTSIGYIVGNAIASHLSTGLGVDRMILLGGSLALIAAAAMTTLTFAGIFAALAIVIPMVVISIGHGLSQPSGIAGAMSANPAIAGAAAGFTGFLQMTTAAGGSLLVGALQETTPVPMVLVITGATLASVLALAAVVAARPHRAPAGNL